MKTCQIFYFTLTFIYLTKSVFASTKDDFIKSIQDIESQLIDLNHRLDKYIISDVKKLKIEMMEGPSNSDKVQKAPNATVHILTMFRWWTGGVRFMFHITYLPLVEDLDVLWTNYQSNISAVNDVHYKDTGSRYSSTAYGDSGPLFIHFVSRKSLRFVSIELSTDKSKDVSDDVYKVTVPSIDIEPYGDIVYQPGHNVSVKIRYSPKDQNFLPNVYVEVVDLKTMKFRKEYLTESNAGLIEVLRSKDGRQTGEVILNIRTAENQVSGLITIEGLLEYKDPTSFIKSIKHKLMKVLRPVSSIHPFPEKFLHIQKSVRWTESGVVSVSPNKKISLYCHAFGLDNANIDWTLKKLDGTTNKFEKITPDFSLNSVYKNPYFVESRILVGSQLLDKPTYTCKAENTLTDQIVEQTFRSDDLSLMLSSFRFSNSEPIKPVNVMQPTPIPSSDDVFTEIVEILNLTSASAKGEYYFAVTYKPLVDDVSVTWFNGTTVLSEVTFESISTNSKFVLVFNMTSQGLHFNDSDDDVPVPSLMVLTNGDIVYETGKDVIVKFRSMARYITTRVDMDAAIDLTNINTKEVIHCRLKDNDLCYHIIKMEREIIIPWYINTSDNNEGTYDVDIRLQTSQNTLSGRITFYTRLTLSTAMLHSITVCKRKTLRPIHQAGAFPKNSLLVRYTNADKDDVVYCGVGEVCQIGCEAWATDIEDVTLVQVTRNRQGSSKQFLSSSTQKDDLTMKVSKTIWVESTDHLKFQCITRKTGGANLTGEFSVVPKPVSMLEILPELSLVSVIESKGKFKLSRYNITCVIQGWQKPDVSFSFVSRSSKERYVEVSSHLVKQVSPFQYTVSMQRSFDHRVPETQLSTVTCHASISQPLPLMASLNLAVPVTHA